jgi:hypothetical protein
VSSVYSNRGVDCRQSDFSQWSGGNRNQETQPEEGCRPAARFHRVRPAWKTERSRIDRPKFKSKGEIQYANARDEECDDRVA